ncbi:uncharacterized protein artn [Lycodopsis pacificus]
MDGCTVFTFHLLQHLRRETQGSVGRAPSRDQQLSHTAATITLPHVNHFNKTAFFHPRNIPNMSLTSAQSSMTSTGTRLTQDKLQEPTHHQQGPQQRGSPYLSDLFHQHAPSRCLSREEHRGRDCATMPRDVTEEPTQSSADDIRVRVDYYGGWLFTLTSMIGRTSTIGKGKTVDGCLTLTRVQSQKFLKPIDPDVTLWVVASLLTLVEDVFSEEDNKESQADLRRVLRQPSLSPAEDLEQDNRVHAPWPKALEEWSLMQEEEIQQSRWRRSQRDPDLPRTSRRNRKKTKSSRDCHLERKQMRVRDLGLGYDSDEIVLFKYCVGICHDSRKNYDLALKALTDNGSISGKKVSGHPCCRPTRYETVSFMDTHTTWQTIKWLSAANCSCLG